MKKLKKLKTSIVRSLNPNKKKPITFDQFVGDIILNNAGSLMEKCAQSDGSDLKQYIEKQRAFNQRYGIER